VRRIWRHWGSLNFWRHDVGCTTTIEPARVKRASRPSTYMLPMLSVHDFATQDSNRKNMRSKCSWECLLSYACPFQVLDSKRQAHTERRVTRKSRPALEIKNSYECLYINVSWVIITIYGEAIWPQSDINDSHIFTLASSVL
jgi:hypothetical protein